MFPKSDKYLSQLTITITCYNDMHTSYTYFPKKCNPDTFLFDQLFPIKYVHISRFAAAAQKKYLKLLSIIMCQIRKTLTCFFENYY